MFNVRVICADGREYIREATDQEVQMRMDEGVCSVDGFAMGYAYTFNFKKKTVPEVKSIPVPDPNRDCDCIIKNSFLRTDYDGDYKKCAMHKEIKFDKPFNYGWYGSHVAFPENLPNVVLHLYNVRTQKGEYHLVSIVNGTVYYPLQCQPVISSGKYIFLNWLEL